MLFKWISVEGTKNGDEFNLITETGQIVGSVEKARTGSWDTYSWLGLPFTFMGRYRTLIDAQTALQEKMNDAFKSRINIASSEQLKVKDTTQLTETDDIGKLCFALHSLDTYPHRPYAGWCHKLDGYNVRLQDLNSPDFFQILCSIIQYIHRDWVVSNEYPGYISISFDETSLDDWRRHLRFQWGTSNEFWGADVLRDNPDAMVVTLIECIDTIMASRTCTIKPVAELIVSHTEKWLAAHSPLAASYQLSVHQLLTISETKAIIADLKSCMHSLSIYDATHKLQSAVICYDRLLSILDVIKEQGEK